jgi:uncharacterized protein (UPF0548 family)
MARPLADRVLTYGALGVTVLPDDAARRAAGIEERAVCLGTGDEVWEYASAEVLRWGVKTRSGFTVDGDTVAVGRRYWVTARVGPLRVREPVEVVAIVNEPDRKGFAYGTLSGHPVSGEEAFLVDRRPDGSVWLTVRSTTGPSRGPWRTIHPALLLVQRGYKRRYLRSLTV